MAVGSFMYIYRGGPKMHKMGLSTNNFQKYFANKVTPKDGAKMESLYRSPMVLHTSVHHMSYAM